MKKKGVSPVIATVLLIAMVVVLALIIFLWFQGLSQERIMKFEKNIELSCSEVAFSVENLGDSILIQNEGDVAIFNLKIQVTEDRSFQTTDIRVEDFEWPSHGLNPGEVYESFLGYDFDTEALFIPVLAGTGEEGEERAYVCDKQWAEELF